MKSPPRHTTATQENIDPDRASLIDTLKRAASNPNLKQWLAEQAAITKARNSFSLFYGKTLAYYHLCI